MADDKHSPLTRFTTNMPLSAKRPVAQRHEQKPIMSREARQPSFPAHFQPDPNAPPETRVVLTTSDLRRMQDAKVRAEVKAEKKVAEILQQAAKRKPGRPKKGAEAK